MACFQSPRRYCSSPTRKWASAPSAGREGGGGPGVLLRPPRRSRRPGEGGPPQVIGTGPKAEPVGVVQKPQRFSIPFLARLTGQRLLPPDTGKHQEQGVTVGDHFGFPSGGKVRGKVRPPPLPPPPSRGGVGGGGPPPQGRAPPGPR